MNRRGERVKTQGGSLSTELVRQKSIFKNLSWQIRQRDKKISFLEKYYGDLQRIISKQQRQESLLQEKLKSKLKPTRNKGISRGDKTENCRKKRIATEPYYPLGMDSVIEEKESQQVLLPRCVV